MAAVSRQRLELAVEHQRAGRLPQAAAIYEELLAASPADADLLQRLGVTLGLLGAHADGARLLAASLEIQPDRLPVLLNLARAMMGLQRPEDALRCADRVLALEASNFEAHRLRGSALAALGRHSDALANLAQAVRLKPDHADALVDLGVALAAVDRPQDALACFERALAVDPRQTQAHHNIALLAASMGDHPRALDSLDRALALQPGDVPLHINRGATLRDLQRLPEALQSFSTALAIDPDNGTAVRNRAIVNLLLQRHPEALLDYQRARQLNGELAADLVGHGAVLLGLGRNDEALPLLERAAALLPGESDAHVQLGVALLRLERHEAAIASFDRALALRPAYPEVLNNRGVALSSLGRPEEALKNFIESAAQAGTVPDTHTNIGVIFKQLGDYRQATWALERARSLRRDDAAAGFELALLHLTLGEFEKGWPLYESRLRVAALDIPRRDFPAPRWDGEAPLTGKTVLVHAEQGLGDTIQFARYLPLLVARGARVVVEVMPQLKALLATLPVPLQIVARGEPLPVVDLHSPLLSLPLAFGTRVQNVPASVPYLSADPARSARWAQRLQPLRGLRVGVAWQGNLRVERLLWAQGRSIPLCALEPLTRVDGVSLVSLQKGPGTEQLREVAFRDRIEELGPDYDAGPDAFLDAAAVMMNLDLVITSDTAIAHLAGSLARPVWVALHVAADWRWLRGRDDSPWYPTMRLFRQGMRNEGWGGVIAAIAAALAQRVNAP